MLPARLNVTTLVSRDVQARRRFYEGLGWESRLDPRDDFARIGTNAATLTLWTRDEAEEEIAAPLRAAGHDFHGYTLAVCVEREHEVDEALETARRAGARIVAEAVQRPFGGRSGYFVDPEGAPWEVVWVPGARLTDGGVFVWP